MLFNHHSTVCCWSVVTAVGLDPRRRSTSAPTGSFQHKVLTSLCSMILIGPNLASFAFQRDRVNMTAIVRLAQVRRAAVAVEALVGIGIDADVVDHQHAGVFEPHPDEAGQIEHRVALARRGNEEQGIFRIGLKATRCSTWPASSGCGSK